MNRTNDLQYKDNQLHIEAAVFGKASVTLPEYYEGYIEDKISEVMQELTEGQEYDSFIFITDTHTNQSSLAGGMVIQYLTLKTGIKKVIHGGDICDNNGTSMEGVKDSISKFSEYIGNYCKELYNVRGNHDFNGKTTSGMQGYNTKVVKDWLLGMSDNNIITNLNDNDGCYYYFDNKASQIRYIIFDMYKESPLGVNNKQDYVQYDWIYNNAIMTTPNNWNIVFVAHESSSKFFSVSAQSHTNIKAIISGAKQKSVVTLQDGRQYDFTNLDANVLAQFAGHSHADIGTWENDVLYIRTTSNKSNHVYSPFTEGTIYYVGEKPLNTANEQALDVVIIKPSDELISCIRVGFGTNRYYHLEKQTISLGETLVLVPSKVVPSKYYSSNCDGGEITSEGWNYNNDIITVSQNGEVTTLQQGDAFVICENSNGDKEYFHITVI